MATHIVTGVAGFIGSNLAEKLLEQGDQVIGIDQFNDYYDPSLKRKNAHILAKYPEFKLIEADIPHDNATAATSTIFIQVFQKLR